MTNLWNSRIRVTQFFRQARKGKENEKTVNGAAATDEEWRTDWRSIYIATLVAFIGAIHQNSIMVWPYLQLLDHTATESFFGLLRSTSGIGSICSSLAAGYISNLVQNTRGTMIFGKTLAIFSCLAYMSIELADGHRKLAFVIFEFTLGIAFGAANTFRTHVAMASTEKDRPKAIGICAFAPALGLLIGPTIQLTFTSIAYPGLPFLFGTHINLFTAPILTAIIISIIALYLLIFHFDGRMRVQPKNNISKNPTITITESGPDESLDKRIELVQFEESPIMKKWGQNFDWSAVAVCLLTRVVISTTLLTFLTVCPPYIQMVFRWNSTEAVKYKSIVMGLIGAHVIAWNLAYVFLDLRKRLSERRAVVGSLFILLGAYLATYPWWFIGGSIPYQDPIEVEMAKNQSGIHEEPLGCPKRFDWCTTTPAVNMYVFLGSLILSLGIALPLSQINLDILYSKVLGRIKQGTMQSVFLVCYDILAIVLPVVLSEIYMATGPTYIWRFDIAVISLCILVWLVFYAKMVSNTRYVQVQQVEVRKQPRNCVAGETFSEKRKVSY